MSSEKKKLVSIVIPAKDEEETIGRLLDDINKEKSKIKKYNFEIIVVDDGCIDKTEKISKSKGAKVVKNTGIHGKGKALTKGFKESKGDFVIMMDADYSHKAEDLTGFLEKLEHGYGLVIGSRHQGGSGEYTLVRAFGNHSLAFAFRLFFGVEIQDPLNGYKGFVKSVAKAPYKSKDFEIEIEIIYHTLLQNLDLIEIPAFERARAGGEMKSRAIKHGTKFLLKIIELGNKFRKEKRNNQSLRK